jgi:GNAT superfamily N-acetyltransferase
MDGITIRPASAADVAIVDAMIREAAAWVDALGVVMWEDGELDADKIRAEVTAGMFHLAVVDGQPAGAIRFQLEDPLFWPDRPEGEAAFVHRLVVSRAFKGRGVARGLLEWAIRHAAAQGRGLLRLDCDANRAKLRALYESCGFRFHSYRQVGPYYVARYEIETAQGLGLKAQERALEPNRREP